MHEQQWAEIVTGVVCNTLALIYLIIDWKRSDS